MADDGELLIGGRRSQHGSHAVDHIRDARGRAGESAGGWNRGSAGQIPLRPDVPGGLPRNQRGPDGESQEMRRSGRSWLPSSMARRAKRFSRPQIRRASPPVRKTRRERAWMERTEPSPLIISRMLTGDSGQFLVEELGTMAVADLQALRQTLDDLDETDGNVTLEQEGTSARLDVTVTRTVDGNGTDFEFDQGNGTSAVHGQVHLTADVSLHLVIGVHDHGFYVDTSSGAQPRLTVDRFAVDPNEPISGQGNVGLLTGEITAGTITFDPSLQVTVNLANPGGDALPFGSSGVVGLRPRTEPKRHRDLDHDREQLRLDRRRHPVPWHPRGRADDLQPRLRLGRTSPTRAARPPRVERWPVIAPPSSDRLGGRLR